MFEDCTFTTMTQSDAAKAGTGTSTHGNSITSSDTIPPPPRGFPPIFGKWSGGTKIK